MRCVYHRRDWLIDRVQFLRGDLASGLRVVGSGSPQLAGPTVAHGSQAEAGSLAIHRDAPPVLGRISAVGIVDVAAAVTWKTAGLVHEPCGIELFGPLGVTERVVLAPTLVEHHPRDDRGMVPTALDEQPPLHLAGGRGFRRSWAGP